MTVKPLNEYTLEELCLHFHENQEILEKNAKRKEMFLYCETCDSPYNIILPQERLPYCDTCCYQSKIALKEFALVSGIDRYLTVLCRLLVRAAGQLNECKARDCLEAIFEYISGKYGWDDQELFIDNPITWYPIDFVCIYDDYISSLSDEYPEDKPDKNDMLKMLYEGVSETIQQRDGMLHKVDRWDIQDLLRLGMDIPSHIARIS